MTGTTLLHGYSLLYYCLSPIPAETCRNGVVRSIILFHDRRMATEPHIADQVHNQ